MTTIITRLYAAKETAVDAVDALKRIGIEAKDVILLASASGKSADIEALLVKGGVPASAAAAYATKLRGGGSLVSVRAPWGFAVGAIKILDRFGPIDAGVHPSEHHVVAGWNEAAPFSAALGLPVLAQSKSSTVLKNDPAPFSKALGARTLSNSKSSTALLSNPAPLSSALGLAALSEAKPFSSLSKSDKPFSSLLKSAAPFSAFFSLPVLLNDRSPRS